LSGGRSSEFFLAFVISDVGRQLLVYGVFLGGDFLSKRALALFKSLLRGVDGNLILGVSELLGVFKSGCLTGLVLG
jgi:hypothetical protein